MCGSLSPSSIRNKAHTAVALRTLAGGWPKATAREAFGPGVERRTDGNQSVAATAPSSSTYGLKASTKSDRSGAINLEGATASGNIYAFTSPDTSGISQVAFYLDDPNMTGTPKQVEKLTPYDFVGGSTSTANPFDTTKVSDGSHTITAKVTLSDGTTKTASASFTVQNNP